MPLNKQKGNMYPFVTHTYNVIRGKCPHQCSYCYMNIYKQKELRFVESELNTNLGKENYIFVGSSTDMWADGVPAWWIDEVLVQCRTYPENTYLFQSKNPERFTHWIADLPPQTVLGCTIESNYDHQVSQAPAPSRRAEWMRMEGVRKMISVEPVMDFDTRVLVDWIRRIGPEFVSVGADSKGHKLPEPPADKLRELLEELVKITEVRTKDNLRRLLRGNGGK